MLTAIFAVLIPVLKGVCLQTLTWKAYNFQSEQLKGDNSGAAMSIAFQQAFMGQAAVVTFLWAHPEFAHPNLLVLMTVFTPLIIGLYAGGFSLWVDNYKRSATNKALLELVAKKTPSFIKTIADLLTHTRVIRLMKTLHVHLGKIIALAQIYLLTQLTLLYPIISVAAFCYGTINFIRNKNLLPYFLSKRIETFNQFLQDFSGIFLSAYNPVFFLFSLYSVGQTLMIRFLSPIALRKILGEDSDFIKLSDIKKVTELKPKIPSDISPKTLQLLLKEIPEIAESIHPDLSTELATIGVKVYKEEIKPIIRRKATGTGKFSVIKEYTSKAIACLTVLKNMFYRLEQAKPIVLNPTHIAYTPHVPKAPKIDFNNIKKEIFENLYTYDGLKGTCRSSVKFQKAAGVELYEELLILNKLQEERASYIKYLNETTKNDKTDILALQRKNSASIAELRTKLISNEPQSNWGSKTESEVLVKSITLCKNKMAEAIESQQKKPASSNTHKESIFSRVLKTVKRLFKKTEQSATTSTESDNTYVYYIKPKIEDYINRVQYGTNMLQDKSIEVVVDFQNQGRFLLDYCGKLLKGGELVVTDKAPNKAMIQNLQKATFFRFGSTLLFVDIDQKRTQTTFEIDNANELDIELSIKDAAIGFKKELSVADFECIALYSGREQSDPKNKALGILVALAIEAGDFCADAVIDETQKQYSSHMEESLLENPAEQMAAFLRGKREESYEKIYAQWLQFLKTDSGAGLQAIYFPSVDFEDKHVKSSITNTLSSLHLQSSENAKHTLSSEENRTLMDKILNDIIAYLITRTLMVTENGYSPQLFMKDFQAALLHTGTALDAKKIRNLFNVWVEHFTNQDTRDLMLSTLDPYSDVNEKDNTAFIENALNKLLSLMFYDTSACKLTNPDTQLAISGILNPAAVPATLSVSSATQLYQAAATNPITSSQTTQPGPAHQRCTIL